MHLAKYLKKHHLTQREFASLIGVDKSLVSQWLTNRRPISAKCALRIDRATNGALPKTLLRRDIFG